VAHGSRHAETNHAAIRFPTSEAAGHPPTSPLAKGALKNNLFKSSEEGQDSQDSQDGLNVVAASKQTGLSCSSCQSCPFQVVQVIVERALTGKKRSAP
jgi:hypothetical protein